MSVLRAAPAATLGIIDDADLQSKRPTLAGRIIAGIGRGMLAMAALALTMLGVVLGAPNAYATDQTQIDAKIGPSLVYISTVYSASVLVPAGVIDADSHWVGPIQVGGTCSGVVVDPSGYIATDGHCVDSTGRETKEMVLWGLLLGDGLKFQGLAPNMSDADAQHFVSVALNQEWPIEGAAPSSPPDRQVQVIQPEGAGRVITEWTTAQVVDFQSPDNEDNALLKVSNVPTLTALPVADEVPPPGTEITTAGFPGDVGMSMDQSRTQPPSFKEGSISSKQVQSNGAARTEVSSAQTNGMSGGPTVNNATGEVIGLVDYGGVNNTTGQEEGGINFITDASSLHSFLLKNGVHLVALPAPAQPFPWVWVAVGGALGLALLAVPVVLVLRRRAKRLSAPRIDGSQLLQPAAATQPAPQQSVDEQQPPGGAPQPAHDQQGDAPVTTPVDRPSTAPPELTPSTIGAVEIK
jgi:serine protease Do